MISVGQRGCRAAEQLVSLLPVTIDNRFGGEGLLTEEQEKPLGVLVFGARRQNAELCALLNGAGLKAEPCAEVGELSVKIRHGAGAVILTEESLQGDQCEVLRREISSAPPWSDLPVLVLTRGQPAERLAAALGERACITLLQWPGPEWALVSSVRAALRARSRQYDCRDRELEQQFQRRILESSADCIKVLDVQGHLLSMNARGCSLMEIENLQQYTGKPLTDFYGEADRAAARAAVAQAASGGTGKLQAYCPSVHGTPRWFDVLITPICGADGRPERLLAISREITQIKLAEQALRESEEKFRVLAEASRVMIAIVRDRRFLYVNPFLVENSGYTREELLTIDIAQLIHPDYREMVLDRARRRQAGEKMPARYEYLMLTKAGEPRWVEIAPVRIEYRGAPAIIGTAVDITVRKAALAEVRQSGERFRAFFENATVGAGQLDVSGRFAAVNDRMCQITGYSREELLRLSLRDITHPEDREADWDAWLRLARGESPAYKGQKRYVRKDGAVIWVEVTAGLVHDAAGQPVGTAGIIQDITHRKEAENAVQHQAEGLRLLSQTATRLLVAEDPRGELSAMLDNVAAHLGAEVYLGYLLTADRQHLRLHCSRGLDEETRRAIEVVDLGQTSCATAAQTGQRVVIENVQEDGSPKAILLRSIGLRAYAAYPLIGDEVLGVISLGARQRARFTHDELGIVQAVADQAAMALIRQRLNSELKQRASELDAANRAKDHFLAVLSHELRTPLTPVLATASMLATDARLGADVRDQVEVIRRNTQMEARLIDDLLDVTRIARGQVELERRPVALRAILEHALEVCRPDIEARGLQLSLDLCGTYTVHADAARLEQVFWNLLNNAIKFTPPGGRVALRCRLDGGDHVITEVVDSGVGIEVDALQRIFNAFEQAEQSHRRQFGGLGLGLAISKALVEMHGGTITAHSRGKGTGATFAVRLPVAPESVPVARRAPQPRAGVPTRAGREPGRRGLRILLVEDHADTVKIITWLLKSAGHVVETAGDIQTALEQIGQAEFDLLISDLGLPDGSGVDLMRELRLRGYDLPGIALTGYGQQEDIERTRQVGFVRHLTKPIELEQLERAISQQFAGAH